MAPMLKQNIKHERLMTLVKNGNVQWCCQSSKHAV